MMRNFWEAEVPKGKHKVFNYCIVKMLSSYIQLLGGVKDMYVEMLTRG